MQSTQKPRLGLKLDAKLTVTEVVPGGACFGHLHVGDTITHVNLKSVEGKDQQTIIDMCCTAWKVILDISRQESKGSSSSKSMKVLIRLPHARPVHTRETIRKQIQTGQKASQDDSDIRRAFQSQAVTSADEEKYAHIPQEKLWPALSKLGIEVSKDALEDFFTKTDTNGDGLIDRNEFLSVVLSPPGQPNRKDIQDAFNAMNPTLDQDGRSFIQLSQMEGAVSSLNMSKKFKDEVLEYFSKGAVEDGMISFEEFNQAVRSVNPLRDEQEIMDVYEIFAIPGTYQYIPEQKLRPALQQLGLLVTDEQMREFERVVRLNFGGKIRFDAFKHIVLSPTPVEEWARSLPLAKLLADALPRHSSCDHLRVISSLTLREIEDISREVGASLQEILTANVRQLSKAFSTMDKEVVQPEAHCAGKFEVVKMTTGKIDDFYEGLEARIGSCPPDFMKAMEAEHCTYKGHDFPFSTSNYTEITQTCAKKEWEIVVKKIPCPENEMRFNRRIPDLEKLNALPLTKKANLVLAEVMSIVLYTGPMYVIYNAIPRKHPEAIFKHFESADNLFTTTIFVLASAIQKISRVMKLPKDMILYRGLGGTADLPDSFFQADACGCKGFVEWGFMSTSSNKAIAISYSGLDQHKPLPLVLAIHVGSADRGACVRDYSQYVSEVEYMYAPMSFIEQIAQERLEVTSAGVVRVIPVGVNTNMKAETTDQLERKKKKLHLASFKYRIGEIKALLSDRAKSDEAKLRIAEDTSNEENKHTLDSFVDKIIQQCTDVYSRHSAFPPSDYNKETKFRSLVLEMVDIKHMAIAKLEEWIQNHQNSFIKFRFNTPLRTAHRRWIMFLQKKFAASSGIDKIEVSFHVLKARGVIMGHVDEKNDLMESVLMTTAAEGRGKRILELLVAAKADVNDARPDRDGVTAIWLAAQFDHPQTIKYLVELGADVNKAATNGATPVYTAAQSGNEECIAALASFKADLCKADEVGLAPMHQAAMNGFVDCIKKLYELKADVNQVDNKGLRPCDYAGKKGHTDCVSVLCEYAQKSAKDAVVPDPSVPSPSRFSTGCKKLIISSGDISDIDGLLALAHYAKTGADVLFVMNYPAYVGLNQTDEDPLYEMNNMGLGYKYSAERIIDTDKATARYTKFMSSYKGSANDRMKGALTDLAFLMVNSVWTDITSESGGELLFTIGGVNAVNPFSPKAIKNEVLVYSEILDPPQRQLPPTQGLIFNRNGVESKLDWDAYSDIYIDFNGSMAFWNESWQTKLTTHAHKIRGAFVMGGVRADETPITMPPIPNVLNRLSGATMNQLYHPECASSFFAFLTSSKVPVFVITNNVVKGLETFAVVMDKKTPTYDGVEKFLDSNGLTSSSLRNYAKAHYNSVYNPPRKPFDFYTALALVTWLSDGHSCEMLTSDSSRRWLFYSNVYGITYVSKYEKWEETLASYVGCVDVTENEKDSEFVKNKKEYFKKEMTVLSEISFVKSLPVYEVAFHMGDEDKKLTLA